MLAVDISPLAIGKAGSLWSHQENIAWRIADIQMLEFPNESFDVVVAYGLFHCLQDEQQIREVVAALKGSTKEHGTHVVCSFDDRAQNLAGHPGFEPCLLSHNALLRL